MGVPVPVQVRVVYNGNGDVAGAGQTTNTLYGPIMTVIEHIDEYCNKQKDIAMNVARSSRACCSPLHFEMRWPK